MSAEKWSVACFSAALLVMCAAAASGRPGAGGATLLAFLLSLVGIGFLMGGAK